MFKQKIKNYRSEEGKKGARPPGQEIDPSPHQCCILSSLDMGHALGLNKEEHVYEAGALSHYQNL